MSEFESGSESSVSTPTESQAPESQPLAESQPGSSPQEVGSESAPDRQTPFHEHPRFKELITHKNESAQRIQNYEKQLQQYQTRVQEMERRMQEGFKKPEPAKPDYGSVIERLKGIDPEFAGLQNQMFERTQQIEQLQQQLQQQVSWQQQQQQEQGHKSAMNRLSELYNEYKVPEEHKGFYQDLIEAEAFRNNKAGLNDLDSIFKGAHERFSKFTDGYSRQIRESYVSSKKSDQTPLTQSGGTPAAPSSGKVSTLDGVKAAIAKSIRQSNQKI